MRVNKLVNYNLYILFNIKTAIIFFFSYDEDGMQPFFDETPHATPPAATGNFVLSF